MGLLDKNFLRQIIQNNLDEEILRGRFGLEKENIRVNKEGRIALTPHPNIFGVKAENPYITADFSESQIEMITPAFDSIEETYHFLEALHDIVSLELNDEYLWPSSNPPVLPDEDIIPIADMGDKGQNEYRFNLAAKYDRKKLCLSGIHFNFSFQESFLKKLYRAQVQRKSFREFRNDIYLKIARNFLRYRWLLIYLTGASPIFHGTFIEECVQKGQSLNNEDYYFPNMNSLRNSEYGYRNKKQLYLSFNSVEEYIASLKAYIHSEELLSVKELYSMVRLKAAASKNPLQALLQHGIKYLEIRTTDLDPFNKNGISKETLTFIHLFLVYMLLIEDRPFGEEEQRLADLDQDVLLTEGITARLNLLNDDCETMQEAGLLMIEEMKELVRSLTSDHQKYMKVLEQNRKALFNPSFNLASRIKNGIEKSSFIEFHLNRAKQYKQDSENTSYRLAGFEDLELSTQILLKAAIKRGIQFEILDRKENFIALSKNGHLEYIKQATKTSLDSYITALIMENKIVTKKVLASHGIRVPNGKDYHDVNEAKTDYDLYQGKQVVIKPKSTNFGLGITIFTGPFAKKEYQKALQLAFAHDNTVLIEEFLTGKEYRFLVMGDEVVGILHRVPANVIGDGVHTIEELVTNKNKDPLRGHGYKTPLEMITLGEVEEMFLKGQGKSRLDIPKHGEIVYLRENSNISTGGDSIDFTDEIHDSYKRIAIQAAKAAHAILCGVDMVIDNIREEADEENYGIIEINFNPAIHIHCYPYKGKNRKAEEKILELLGFGQSEGVALDSESEDVQHSELKKDMLVRHKAIF